MMLQRIGIHGFLGCVAAAILVFAMGEPVRSQDKDGARADRAKARARAAGDKDGAQRRQRGQRPGADGRRPGQQGRGGQSSGLRALGSLDLSDGQKSKIEEIQKGIQETQKAWQEQNADKIKEIQEEFAALREKAKDGGREGIREAAQGLMKKRQEIFESRPDSKDAIKKILEILTQEQKDNLLVALLSGQGQRGPQAGQDGQRRGGQRPGARPGGDGARRPGARPSNRDGARPTNRDGARPDARRRRPDQDK